MEMPKLPKIFSFKNIIKRAPYIVEDENATFTLTEKLDGCFEYNTRVLLADGTTKTIGEIVNKRLPVEVLTWNPRTGAIEVRRVIGWYKNGITDRWLRIRVRGRHGEKISLKVTPNHLIMTPSGWKPAKELNVGDEVVIVTDGVPDIHIQILLGILLGDASYTSGRVQYAKKEEHYEIIKTLNRIFNSFATYEYKRVSGYGTNMIQWTLNMSNRIVKVVGDIVLKNGKKTVNDKWCRMLSPLALAWWYMDDGHLNGKYAVFHTEGFSLEEIQLLSDMLRNKFGLENSIRDTGRGYVIALTTKATKLLHLMIAPYIVNCMKYKLLEDFRDIEPVYDYSTFHKSNELATSTVISVEDFVPSSRMKYDIEVEGTHCFFVGSKYSAVLVHNSQWRVVLTRDGWNAGSKNVWGKNNVAKGMFGLALQRTQELWERWLDTDLPELWLYTEYMQSNKHNVLKYDRAPKNNLYLFAAKDLDNNRWLKEDELVELAKVLDIEPPNVLGAVSFPSQVLLDKVISLGSVLGGKMEGVVMTTYDYDSGYVWGIPQWYGFPLKVKYVSDEFKEVAEIEWSKGSKKVKQQGLQTINDLVNSLLDKYVTEPRLRKVRMQLQEKGLYTGTEKDIGVAIKTFWEDLSEEEYQNIVDDILKIVMKQFRKKLGRRIASMVKSMDW